MEKKGDLIYTQLQIRQLKPLITNSKKQLSKKAALHECRALYISFE